MDSETTMAREAEMSGHWRALQRSPMPRPTASVPRRVDSPHRTQPVSGSREDGARGPPWSHAKRLAAHKAMRLLRCQRPSPRLHTDSCQTPSSLAAGSCNASDSDRVRRVPKRGLFSICAVVHVAETARLPRVECASNAVELRLRQTRRLCEFCFPPLSQQTIHGRPPIALLKMKMPLKPPELRSCPCTTDEALPAPLRAALTFDLSDLRECDL